MKTTFCEELKCACVGAEGWISFFFSNGVLEASMKKIGRENRQRMEKKASRE